MSPSKPSRPSRVHILGVPIDPLTVSDLHEHLLRFVRTRARATVLYANVHAVNLASRYPWFGRCMQEADLVLCDGHGVMLGARLLRQTLPERITYADWTWQLAAFCEQESWSLFLLGGRPGVADTAAQRLCDRYPRLRVAGTHHGYFDKGSASAANASVIAAINSGTPDIVIVGFGMPIQEQWVEANRAQINAPVVLTGGAVFDYISGRLRRPPRWMTAHGLEWLGRLSLEPHRLMGRYIAGNPKFLWRVLRARFTRHRRDENTP